MTNTFFTPGLQLMANYINPNPIASSIAKYKFIKGNVSLNDLKFSNVYPMYIVSTKKLFNLRLIIKDANQDNMDMSILKFPLKFCNLITGCQLNRIKDKYTYKIPWKQFKMKSLIGPAMKNCKLFFEIDYVELDDDKYESILYIHNEDMKGDDIYQLETISKCDNILEIQGISTLLKDANTIHIPFKNCAKGLFFNGINKKKISTIKILVNDEIKFDYDHEKIQLFLNKVNNNDNFYYLAFDCLNYLSTNWKNAIDFNDNDVKCIITIKNHNINHSPILSIYVLSYNNLIYKNNSIKKIYSKPTNLINDKFITGYEKIKECDVNLCPICRDVNSNVITSCYHQYCSDCLNELYQYNKNVKCPLCTNFIGKNNKYIEILN